MFLQNFQLLYYKHPQQMEDRPVLQRVSMILAFTKPFLMSLIHLRHDPNPDGWPGNC